MYKGIDISTYQTGIDWNRVKKSGCDFAVIRAGFGNDISQKDNMFESHIKGALEVGIKVGIYWFGYAYTEAMARQEADVCHRVISAYRDKLSLPVFYDWEYDSMRYAKDNGVTPDRALVTGMTIAFMDRMKELGYESGYYTNQDYLGNYYDTGRMKGYPLWMAYCSSDRYPGCVMQQYTSSGKIDGIPGNVDCNYFYGEFDEGEEPVTPGVDITVTYRVRTQKHGWLPEVNDLNDYAGWEDSPVTDIAVKVSQGSVKYRVHNLGGSWLPWVTGYHINDAANGYAGDGRVIDAVEIYYYTPDHIRPYRKAKYRVAPVGGDYYAWQYDNEKTGGQDGYAGLFGKSIGKFQMTVE